MTKASVIRFIGCIVGLGLLSGCDPVPQSNYWYIEKVMWSGGQVAVFHNRTWTDPRDCDVVALELTTRFADVGAAYRCFQDNAWTPRPVPEEKKP